MSEQSVRVHLLADGTMKVDCNGVCMLDMRDVTDFEVFDERTDQATATVAAGTNAAIGCEPSSGGASSPNQREDDERLDTENRDDRGASGKDSDNRNIFRTSVRPGQVLEVTVMEDKRHKLMYDQLVEMVNILPSSSTHIKQDILDVVREVDGMTT